jgi:4-aminobutyrate aminotransferase-like enzyme
LFEPVLGRGGYVFPHKDYFAEVFKLFKKYNIVTIADEVQMGFYRTGTQWSFEHYGIVPDIIVFGKAITNGLWPLSGIWAKEEIISPELWPVGSTHCTFSGHPLGTAIGLKTFELLECQENLGKIRKSEQYFEKIIHMLDAKYSFIKRAQVKGHAAGLDLFLPASNEPATEKVKQLINLALTDPITMNNQKYGLILTSGGMFNSSIMLSPSVYINDSDLDIFTILFETYIKMVFS